MKRIAITIFLGLALIAAPVSLSLETHGLQLAQSVAYAAYPKVNLVQNTDPQTVAANIIQFLLILAGALAVIFLIFGGIRYITSSGSPDGIEKAKNTITYSIVGVIVIILSYIIVSILNNAGSGL